ncbi:MAG: hypothetical protein P8Y53_15710 [Pseudolabrys sp.]
MDYQQKQAFKQKLTIGGLSVVGGAIAWWIVLSSGLGWMSPTTAQQHTSDAVQAKVDKILAPFCAERFMADKAAMAKFLKIDGGYDRDELVQKTLPKVGATKVDYQLSENCADAIKADLKKASSKAAPGAPKKS